jgi:tetratricopeptide (TPR) repeat protein
MLNSGIEQAKAKNFVLAYQLIASAVVADPSYDRAWFQLGQANFDMGLRAAALACYRRALACEKADTETAKIHCNLGHTAYHLGHNQDARLHTQLSIDLDPSLAFSYCNMSLIESVDGYLGASLDWAIKAHQMMPEDATIETALAFAYLFHREWAKGLKHFEARFRYRLPQFANYPYPQWQGEDGKVVFVVSEQGMGDTLAYSRFIRAACKRVDFVHFGVQPEVLRLMRASLADVPNLNILPQPCPFPPASAWSTPMSLPVALGLTDKEIEETPHITMPRFSLGGSAWKDPSARLHIGVAWSGSPAADINHERSFPVTQLLDLYEVPGIALYSLQMDERYQDLHTTGCVALIRDMKPSIKDVADTVAVLDHLDMIITTESALGHIGGLCRKETWIAYSWLGRSFHIGHDGRGGVPGYPKHRVFKQSANRQWGPVFDRIVDALDRKLKKPEAEAAE